MYKIVFLITYLLYFLNEFDQKRIFIFKQIFLLSS